MKAIDLSGRTPSGKRVKLADEVPLATPFVFYVFPVYACNFKCRYCIFSVEKAKRVFISDAVTMDFALYQKVIDDAKQFPSRFKVLRFVGMGEPLLHKNIADMVRYAAQRQVADTIEIITNASLLTPALSEALVEAGLSRLIVSLQGTSSEKYQEVSDVRIDFGALVGNIGHFHRIAAGKAHLYVKIMDTVLTGKEDEQRFFEIFGDICDSLAIEHTVPIYPGVDYQRVLGEVDLPVTQFGVPLSDTGICPQPFFSMQVNPDGKVVPCFSLDYPEIIGDCRQESVYDIWNGARFNRFRRRMLDGSENVGRVCANCNIIKYRMSPEDSLQAAAARLKRHYEG